MIDSHCHLEQDDYNKDRQKVIDGCKKKLKAVVTCCADPKDWKRTKEIVLKNKGFVFATAGVHPEFIKDIPAEEIKSFFDVIREEAKEKNIVAIGEVGLDYYWIKEHIQRDRQKELFIKFINLAKELKLPLVIHSRDAFLDTVTLLEQHGMQGHKILLHMFGDRKLIERVAKNGWMVSIGPGIMRSKTTRKIARDLPLDNLLIETDSPWFGSEEEKRGTPLNTFKAAEKIAEEKGISAEEVEKQTDKNAIAFFGLKLK
jgi:TatD DNase family protein